MRTDIKFNAIEMPNRKPCRPWLQFALRCRENTGAFCHKMATTKQDIPITLSAIGFGFRLGKSIAASF
jgi:hypothetical protein